MNLASALSALVRRGRPKVTLPSEPRPITAAEVEVIAPPPALQYREPVARAGAAAAAAADGIRPATAHNDSIDVVRFFAAAGVVFTHSIESPFFDRWGNLFRFAVPFFLFASLYFQTLSLRRNRDRTLGGYVAARFHRLYLPFLAWSVI